jgi:serine phosphatase RsbU (regulator of sigma subunit)
MAVRRHRRRPADPRRGRLLATITAACASVSLACIPAATARSGHERSTGHGKGAPAPATPSAGAPATAAPQAARPEAPVEATPTAKPTKPTAKPTKHSKRPGGAPTPTAATIVPATGAATKSGKAKHAEAGSTSEQRRSQEGASSRATSTHVTRAKAKKVEAARAAAPQASGAGSGAAASTATPVTPATTSPAALAAALPSATATSPVATSPSQPTAPAASPVRSARARRHARKPARASTRTSGIAALPAAGFLAAATPAGAAPASGPAPAPRHHGHGTASPSIVAPLATTITKVVDVVPTPIRALIGALLALALAFAVRSRFVARRARRLEQQRSQLLEDVGLLQAALLPVPPARLGPVGTTAAYRPAAGPAAGGDFYDVFALEDGQLAVIVGDVSGHGRTALPHTALVRFTLRAYLEAGLSPRGAVQTAGSVLHRQLGGFFVTVVAATYNPRTRVLVYASAGHPPPVVLGADDAALTPVTASSSPPIGVGMPTGTRQSIVSVPGRAQICFHTDGVTEARVANELFGRGRLTDALVEVGSHGTASELLDRVAEVVDRRPDDMAACLLSVEGDTRAPLTLREELELDRETVASERTEQFLLSCGLRAAEVPAVMHVAAAAVARAGSAVLEVHQEEGRARASLQHDNITWLQTRSGPRHNDLVVSR